MARYKRKPVNIQAVRIQLILDWAKNNWGALPVWVRDAYEAGMLFFGNTNISIKTQKGIQYGQQDEMLCCGSFNELYTVRCDTFEKQYELISE